MRQYVHISATLDKKLFEKVEGFCNIEERSKSWLISKAVEEYLENLEDVEIAYQRMVDPKSKIISSKELRTHLNV